jgi:hypothetical protein
MMPATGDVLLEFGATFGVDSNFLTGNGANVQAWLDGGSGGTAAQTLVGAHTSAPARCRLGARTSRPARTR